MKNLFKFYFLLFVSLFFASCSKTVVKPQEFSSPDLVNGYYYYAPKCEQGEFWLYIHDSDYKLIKNLKIFNGKLINKNKNILLQNRPEIFVNKAKEKLFLVSANNKLCSLEKFDVFFDSKNMLLYNSKKIKKSYNQVFAKIILNRQSSSKTANLLIDCDRSMYELDKIKKFKHQFGLGSYQKIHNKTFEPIQKKSVFQKVFDYHCIEK